MKSKTFILGLGAQKAGTSWVYDYLHSDPSTSFSGIKEYHVWDALHLPEARHFDLRSVSQPLAPVHSAVRRLLGKGRHIPSVRKHLQADAEHYFAHFVQLLSADGATVTGDITPAYAGLPPSVLAEIREGFAARQIETRTIFMMRDPVGRCISAAQMNRRTGSVKEGVPTDGSLDEAVLAYAATDECRVRSDYSSTVRAIRSVFPETDSYFGIYETMFEESEIARLSDFVGVGFRPGLATKQVNAHRQTEGVSDETRAVLRQRFAQVYEDCSAEFPGTVAAWQAVG